MNKFKLILKNVFLVIIIYLIVNILGYIFLTITFVYTSSKDYCTKEKVLLNYGSSFDDYINCYISYINNLDSIIKYTICDFRRFDVCENFNE